MLPRPLCPLPIRPIKIGTGAGPADLWVEVTHRVCGQDEA